MWFKYSKKSDDKDEYIGLDNESKAMRRAEKINAYWAKRGVDANAIAYKRAVIVSSRYGARRFEVWEIRSDLTGRESATVGYM